MGTASSLAQIPSGPVDTIPEAVARMSAISDALPPTDGLACFNRMYLIVTEKVLEEVSGPSVFADPAFMSQFDVVFVNLYLGAIDAFRAEPPTAPRCWSELLAHRSNTDIDPVQFALAGMSAHINHDLPIAVVKTCEDRNVTLAQVPHKADFDTMNATLGALDQEVRESFEKGIILELDRKTAGLENRVGNFCIDAARDAAWASAVALWRIRGEARLSKDYCGGLDLAAALAGRAILVPLGAL
jgi:hypothetical protein